MPIETYRGLDGNLHTREVPYEWERIAEGNRLQKEWEEEHKDNLEDELAIRSSGNKKFNSMKQLQTEFRKIDSGAWEKLSRRIRREVPRGLKRGLMAGVGGLIFYAGLTCNISISENGLEKDNPREDNPMGYFATVGNRIQNEFGLDDYPLAQRREVLRMLAPYMDEAEKKLPEIEKSEKWEDIHYLFNYGNNVHGLTNRFISPWVRSNYIHLEEATKGYLEEGEDRYPLGFAPKSYKKEFFRGEDEVVFMPERTLVHGIAYLRQSIANGRDLADTYASFYSTEEEIRNAIRETDSVRYFPTFGENGEMLEVGYGSALKKHEQDLINSAVAIHYLTDADGEVVHFDRLPTIRRKAREERR